MKRKPIKSAVIVKFSSKTGAYRFKRMINSMIKSGDLPFSLTLHLKEKLVEQEII